MAAPKAKGKGGAKGPKTLAPTKAAPKQKAKPAKKKK